jgi:hypothetical protein
MDDLTNLGRRISFFERTLDDLTTWVVRNITRAEEERMPLEVTATLDEVRLELELKKAAYRDLLRELGERD